MSHGVYTERLDVWSVGCIFGELLQRQTQAASTPNLQCPPLFAVSGDARTPGSREELENDCVTSMELRMLFRVIGTPTWCDLAEVPGERWRSFLANLPGAPGTLHKRFAGASDEAVDLLLRMLTFSPTRRCSALEAMHHTYFSSVGGDYAAPDTATLPHVDSVARAVRQVEDELERMDDERDDDRWRDRLKAMLRRECETLATASMNLGPIVEEPATASASLGWVDLWGVGGGAPAVEYSRDLNEDHMREREVYARGGADSGLSVRPVDLLGRGRHGEWTVERARPRRVVPGAVWGVSSGSGDAGDTIASQQAR